MAKPYTAGKHVSLVSLPLSYQLLSPKVAQIDDAIE